MAGAAVVLASPFDAQSALRFWRPIVKYGADTFWLAPTMLAALLKVDRDRAGAEYCRTRVRSICVATAPLPLKVKEEFEARYGVELFESYGLSELLLLTANSPRAPRVKGSVGRALPSVKVKVADEDGRPLAAGTDGEIFIRTPFVMAGYLDYETSEPSPVGVADWFPTGDIGHIATSGDIFITARRKDLIIRGGVNVSPRAVEEVLLRHPAVEQVAVVGLPHEFYGEEVVAAVGFKPGHELASEQSSLHELCKRSLGVAATPTRYVEVENFPASANGKIQKGKLREFILSGKAAAG
jgi:long-chain acyl-CoA synthetase